MPYTEFHYTPTGTGVISGKEVLEQTEDAINDLGGQISGDVQTAIDTANNALNTANTASADAQNAVNTANTAYTTATNAQNTANAAQNTASNALTAAQNAQNDVNALGNRVTTAEGNITQNTNAITGLTTRMGTAEGNITTLQNDVVTAQGTATSAQNTATMARQQAYVLRYSSTAITDNSTIAYSTLDNTDNIKADDKILDVDGKIFSIVSVDSDNSTVTVGSALIDLALDSTVMHLSGDETAAGQKTFSNMSSFLGSYLGNESSTNERTNFYLRSNRDTADKSGAYISRFRPNKNQGGLVGSDNSFISISFLENETRYTRCFDFGLTDWDSDGIPQTYYFTSLSGKGALGTSSRKWQLINGIEPSSLSLPSGNTADRVDISSYITAFDGTTNSYTPPANGWLSISVDNSTEVYVFLNNLYGVNNSRPTAGSIRVTLPVIQGIAVAIRITGGTLTFARFIPCQGNV